VDKIFEISVVTYPAYPNSEAQLNSSENLTVAFRSLQNAKAEQKPEPNDRKLDLLQRKMRQY
jgi:phage head maturation protease